jgi:hypothetical protein
LGLKSRLAANKPFLSAYILHIIGFFGYACDNALRERTLIQALKHAEGRLNSQGIEVMAELVTGVDERTGGPVIEDRSAMAEFRYENGYALLGTDLGKHGVKIELRHKDEDVAAIILPPEQARQCAGWLLGTLGQDGHNLPQELPDILRRIIKRKQPGPILDHGDKKKIQDTLRVLRSLAPGRARSWPARRANESRVFNHRVSR